MSTGSCHAIDNCFLVVHSCLLFVLVIFCLQLGYTPLHQAAQQGHLAVINLLLKYQASPNAITHASILIGRRVLLVTVVTVCNRNRSLRISGVPLKSHADQGISLYTSAVTNQRGLSKG